MRKINKIIKQINEVCEWTVDHYENDEGNSVAEFVDSLGYSGEMLHEVEEALTRFDREGELNDEQINFIRNIIKSNKRNVAAEIIRGFCDLNCFDDIRYRDREICSMTIGEQEVELEFIKSIDTLTDEERAYVRKNANWYVNEKLTFASVGLDYTRWCLRIDEDKLNDEIINSSTQKMPKLKLIVGGVR
jgi:hypothetical protein